MKKVSFICIIFVSIFLLSANDEQPKEKYYYSFEEKIPLYEAPNKVVLSYDEKYLSEVQSNLQHNAQILNMDFKEENNYVILTTAENSNVRYLKEDLKKLNGVRSVNPLYLIYGGTEAPVTGEICVQFKVNVSQLKIDSLLQKYRLTVVYFHPGSHTQRFFVPIDLDLLEVANSIQESGFANYCHPNFLLKKVLFQSLPADPYFGNQYYLHNTGQTVNGRTCTAFADIKAVNAWSITKGSSNIIIAVIDEGVTDNHPDLPNSRQVRLPGSNFGSGSSNNPSPTNNENHGNACAGIIAASHNNEGIAGIAPNCKIMPIRSFNSVDDADAIRFAADNGADVISCSWGYEFFDLKGNIKVPSTNELPYVESAIQYATTNGRKIGNVKYGCVVVFAAGNTANHTGNDAGYVTFPANVNIPGVLTVGASDRNDFQANYSPTSVLSSPNNQIIDVVAPSHSAYSCQINTETLDVWTIDIPGNPGYNPVKDRDCLQNAWLPIPGTILPNTGTNHESYTGHFGGTSAACPQVAGVAALILSIKPDLHQINVAGIIRATARKARNNTTYNYQTTAGRPDGTWCPQMGYGVLDANAAVNAVAPFISATVSVICPYGTYCLNTFQPASWSVSSGFSVSPSTGTGTQVTASSPLIGQSGTLTAYSYGVTVTKTIQVCNQTAITGPSTVCTSDVYSITTGLSASWSVSSGFSVYPATGVSTTVTASSPNGQSGTVTAVVNGTTYTKSIEACSAYISGPDKICTTATYTLNGDQASYWQVAPPNLASILSYNATSVTVSANSNNGAFGSVVAILSGGGGIAKTVQTTCSKSNSNGYNFWIYPNPVDDILYIEIDVDAATQTSGIQSNKTKLVFDVRLYDGKNNLLLQQKTKGGTVEFNVSNLPDGIYYLHIYDGVNSKPEMQQIVVEH